MLKKVIPTNLYVSEYKLISGPTMKGEGWRTLNNKKVMKTVQNTLRFIKSTKALPSMKLTRSYKKLRTLK